MIRKVPGKRKRERQSTMVIGIGHFGRNITATEAINNGIQSLDIIEERGTVDSAMQPSAMWWKTRQATDHTRIVCVRYSTNWWWWSKSAITYTLASTSTEAINGGNHEPDYPRWTGYRCFCRDEHRNVETKTPANYRIRVEKRRIASRWRKLESADMNQFCTYRKKWTAAINRNGTMKKRDGIRFGS